jgi:hypothetical protein
VKNHLEASLPPRRLEPAARRRDQGSPVANAVATVDQEAKDVVDHFGALQVVATAFLFGLGAARRLRR